jgi:DNA polymerase elongation subunit (family B)
MESIPLQNICNLGRELYLFNRQPDGTLSVLTNKTFFPYYYKADERGVFRGYFGNKFSKIIVKNPWDVRDLRDVKVDGESDIIYTRRYLIDKVNIIKSKTRWMMFDIETKSKTMPNPHLAPDQITSITAYDNYEKEYKQFWCEDYSSEYALIEAFIQYIQHCKPDLLVAYNADGFDTPYLINRYPNFSEQISPIHKAGKTTQLPYGLTILDYYQLIIKVYKYKRNTLDYIYSEEFKVPRNKIKYRFDVIAPIIKEKNLEDVHKMVALEEKLNIIEYFDEIRRLTKVLWTDLLHFSVTIDSLILQTAKEQGVVLPSKPDEEEKIRRQEEDEITGGYVFAEPGRYECVSLFDVSGTYPALITTFNLDPANKRDVITNGCIKVRKVIIKQNSDAIVPTVCNRLIASRAQIKQELEKLSGDEYELLKKKDDAHKSMNNTLYGILLFKNSRIYDKDIADTITYLARFLIRYTKYVLYKMGYIVVASDTDSFFVKSIESEKIENLVNTIIIPNWLKHFGKESTNIKFKYEGHFKSAVFEAPKHYKGHFINAKGEEKEVTKGIEIVRRDSSLYQEKFLETLYSKILNGDNEDQCTKWVLAEIENFRTLSLQEISSPFQINDTTVYNSIPIFMRAIEYTNELIPNFSKEYHNELFYIYIKSLGTAKRHSRRNVKNKETGKKELKESDTIIEKNVLAFDSNDISHIKEVDYDKMIEKNIIKKAQKLYHILKWDFTKIQPKKQRKIIKESQA